MTWTGLRVGYDILDGTKKTSSDLASISSLWTARWDSECYLPVHYLHRAGLVILLQSTLYFPVWSALTFVTQELLLLSCKGARNSSKQGGTAEGVKAKDTGASNLLVLYQPHWQGGNCMSLWVRQRGLATLSGTDIDTISCPDTLRCGGELNAHQGQECYICTAGQLKCECWHSG